MTLSTFRFSPDVLARLGEELTGGIESGILELVKNAYDADALECVVELLDVDRPGGTIRVDDDGDGMTARAIRDGWLVVGRSDKDPRATTRLGRSPAGSKGLGRLAAIRSGAKVNLMTRRRRSRSTLQLKIDWADFDDAETVEDVALPVTRTSKGRRRPGTRIEITDLSIQMTESDVRKLARELVLLSDPFMSRQGFRAILKAPAFEELEQLVQASYFEQVAFHLRATVNAKGRARVSVKNRAGKVLWKSGKDDLPDQYECPPATFEIWVFLLEAESFAGSRVTVNEVRRWLREVGGVHLYHRGLRVKPYGDPGFDWLDMNLRRAAAPELRPSTNTSVGRVTIDDPDYELQPKTDRSGFIERGAFSEVRKFAIDSLEWMQKRRLAEREANRTVKKRETLDSVEAAQATMVEAISKLPANRRPDLARAAKVFQQASEERHEALESEIQLYRAMATVGTTTAVMAHEISSAGSDALAGSDTLLRRAGKLKPPGRHQITRSAEAIRANVVHLVALVRVPLQSLQKQRRRSRSYDLNGLVSDSIKQMEPYLEESNILYTFSPNPTRLNVRLARIDIDVIVMNLLTNAIKAFRRSDAAAADRTLELSLIEAGDCATLIVRDSGPGVTVSPPESIWLPGVTSDEDGTGLGLTIVRDTAASLGGEVSATPSGKLGGAEFAVEIPLSDPK